MNISFKTRLMGQLNKICSSEKMFSVDIHDLFINYFNLSYLWFNCFQCFHSNFECYQMKQMKNGLIISHQRWEKLYLAMCKVHFELMKVYMKCVGKKTKMKFVFWLLNLLTITLHIQYSWPFDWLINIETSKFSNKIHQILMKSVTCK